jgi:kynureninase
MAVGIFSLAETITDATWKEYAVEAEKRDCETAASCMVDKFNMPCNGEGNRLVYVCGNSLGPQPKSDPSVVMRELGAWQRLYWIVKWLRVSLFTSL